MYKLYRIHAFYSPFDFRNFDFLNNTVAPCWAFLAEEQYKSSSFKSALFGLIRFSNIVIVDSNEISVLGFALLDKTDIDNLFVQTRTSKICIHINEVYPNYLKNYCSTIPNLTGWHINYSSFEPMAQFLTVQYMSHVFTCHKIDKPESYSYK